MCDAYSSGGTHTPNRVRVDMLLAWDWEQAIKCLRIRRSSLNVGFPWIPGTASGKADTMCALLVDLTAEDMVA